MKKIPWLPTILVVISALLFFFFTYIADIRNLTGVESVCLQFFTLCLSIWGSYIFGRQTSAEAAREMIKPHARSALRRLWSLYDSISRVAKITDEPDLDHIKITKIQAIVREQIVTADDALADWQDIVPESVEELRKKVHTSGRGDQDG